MGFAASPCEANIGAAEPATGGSKPPAESSQSPPRGLQAHAIQPLAAALAVAALILLVVSGCGGPNAADVALITGNPAPTTSPGAPSNPPGTASPTASPTPGAPAALRFVGAQPDTIGVRGSGLPEQSTLTFQVTDAFGTPVGGVTVSFSLSAVADESIAPSEGITGADGNVQVVLTSGQRTASVQITAEVDSVSPPLIVSSTAVVILGAPPSQLHFSLAHQFHNISGRVTFGLTDQITAFVGDRFGNPVAPTAVSFTTNGGVIGNLTTTNALGQATATLVSQLPVPGNGIVSTLATTHGERPFVDTNGNGVCDAGEEVLAVAEPFYDANCNGQYDAGEDFIDLNGDHQFNSDQGSGTRACSDQVIISDSICTTFSANTIVQLVPSGSGPIPAGGSRSYTLTISDIDGNPIVGGSTVNIAVGGRAKLLGPASFSIADAQTFGQIVDGVNRFQFTVVDNAPASQTSETDGVTVAVTSESLAAGGNGSVIVTDVITFLAVPTPTPTPTFVPTLTPTPTVTPTPTITPTATPAAVHLQVALFVNQAASNGDGTLSTVISALVTDATGAAVGNGTVVRFALVDPVPAGVSVTSPGFTGQAAPCTLGFPVVAQPGDALSCIKYDQARAGQTVTVRAVVQTPSGPITDTQTITLPDLRTATPTSTPSFTATPTPTSTPTATPAAVHIQVALFINQASSNGDGTLSSVISALVTDASGAVVGGDVPVEFSLLAPVPAGVSVTSPGLTGQAAPCTLGFPVVPQPGDALSCVKYDTARQGETVTVQALVNTPSGPLMSTQSIILPDLRPTATPTLTPTPTPTETPTPTVTLTSTPAAMHIEVALFVSQAGNNGDGTLSAVISALVTDATGATVGNGIPVQFSLVAPVPSGVSVTNPGITGQAAPCTLGFPVLPQPGDALSCVKYNQARQGQMVTVQALVQTPSGPLMDTQVITLPDLRTATPTNTPTLTPTATPTSTPTPTITLTPTPAAMHIQVALFVNQASNNGDGTLSSVVSALVTDATGATVGNGVAVQFSLTPPVAGVSVTSPGLTGQAPPCTLGFPVVPQPGDALSCVKYDSARQGLAVTVRALVETPSGPLISTQVIALPDLRTSTPTATPTATFTPSPTRTPTPTAPAAHIQLALFINQASSNGDGTLSTVISALVTDSSGVTVGNGAPVLFSLLPPVPSGVSVTSPGFTGQMEPPCTLSFAVVPQPGDALSCIKYDQALQGQVVQVQALVQTISGPTLTSTQFITLPDLRPTATPTPLPTLAPFALQFVSASPAPIGVRASGRPEQSVLSFRLTDALGKPVANFPMTFSLSVVQGESLNPVHTLTDANGMATTTLTSGTRAMTVQVIAGVDSDNNGSIDLSAQSTAVSIFGGPPVQNRFSVAAEKLNVPGRVLFGVQDKISAFVNDLFGNAVAPTAVSFTSNGASVVNPTTTTDANGIATATLVTEQDIPPTGIVTVLAYTRGEEAFRDNNANGLFDPGIDDLLSDNEPEPFIDFRPLPKFLAPAGPNDMNCPIAPPSPLCNNLFNPGFPFEMFVDGNEDKAWNTQGTSGVWDNNILVFARIPVTFSGPLVTPVVSPQSFAIPDGGSVGFTLDVHDDLFNPLASGSTITITVNGGTVFGSPITVPDGESFNQVISGLNRFAFVVSDAQPFENPPLPPVGTSIVVTVNSPNGSGSFIVASGTID